VGKPRRISFGRRREVERAHLVVRKLRCPQCWHRESVIGKRTEKVICPRCLLWDEAEVTMNPIGGKRK
jgi:ribosomal protein S27E